MKTNAAPTKIISNQFQEQWGYREKNKDGTISILLHRDGDLPATTSKTFDGKIYCEYYQNNKKHRSGGKPAVTQVSEDGSFTFTEEYYEHGIEHREDDLPSRINKQLLREDSADLNYTIHEEYKFNGILHRDTDNPSISIGIVFKGKKFQVLNEYYKHGKIRRNEELPAISIHNIKDGEINQFFINERGKICKIKRGMSRYLAIKESDFFYTTYTKINKFDFT